MPRPVVLVHGYSSEGNSASDVESIRKIYGQLPEQLAEQGIAIETINVSRYISLDDGLSIDDLSLALDRALRDHPTLSTGEFDAIIHSTGALVLRNWVRRYTSPGNCRLRHLIHLAGANLGSGWAHIGAGQLARFGRALQGLQPGLGVLSALELASGWTIDLHRHFTQDGKKMVEDYGVLEFSIIGSEVPPEYLLIPIRYGKEDGSDGVVRVSASNLNYNYIKIGPALPAGEVNWDEAVKYAKAKIRESSGVGSAKSDHLYYQVKEESVAGQHRTRVPFAIPYGTNHSERSKQGNVVGGEANREVMMNLITEALASTDETYLDSVVNFANVTQATYDQVSNRESHESNFFAGLQKRLADAARSVLDDPIAQYDGHAQVVFRVTGPFGQPVNDFSVYFNSFGGDRKPDRLIDELFEDRHKNGITPNSINFYLRVAKFDPKSGQQVNRLDEVFGVNLEIDAVDNASNRVIYVPVRLEITAEQLRHWIRPHQTTIVDIELLRLPEASAFVIRTLP